MNICGKLAEARKEFHKLPIRKTGVNTFQKYTYFELGDFVIQGMDCLRNAGLVSIVSFTSDLATMTVYEIDGDGLIIITSPMAELNLKGTHPIQNMGGIETYQRRYLWMALLEIIESDFAEKSQPKEAEPLATEKQIVQIKDLVEADSFSDERVAWISKHIDTMTEAQANKILGSV